MKLLTDSRPPRQLIVQITDACNARCTQCGMNVDAGFRRNRLPLSYALVLVRQAAAHGFRAISFTGGEPFMDLEYLVRVVAEAQACGFEHIRTGTNGFLFAGAHPSTFGYEISRVARALTRAGLTHLWISLDSADAETHERGRGLPGVVEGIRRALPIFHSYGLFPAVNIGVTRNLGRYPIESGQPGQFATLAREALEELFAFTVDLGFTNAGVCYPMSDQSDAAYYATSSDWMVHFSEAERSLLFDSLLRTLPAARPRLRIFTPRSSLHALRAEHAFRAQPPIESDHIERVGTATDERADETRFGGRGFPCLGGRDFFFIAAADGLLYPCGYRGAEKLGQLWDFDFDLDGQTAPACRRCDWECFRDPSELIGRARRQRRAPLALLSSRFGDGSDRNRLWAEDLRYALACDLFDGRKPPDHRRLRSHGPRDDDKARLETARLVNHLQDCQMSSASAKRRRHVPVVAVASPVPPREELVWNAPQEVLTAGLESPRG